MHILAQHRLDRGISQRDFARLVAVDQSIISKIETGTIRPSLSLALRIDAMTDGKVPVSVWADRHVATSKEPASEKSVAS